MQWITPKELQKALLENDSWLILDIRESYELDICSIAGTHIPMGEIVLRHAELDSNKNIVVMCKTGKRAEAVANLLSCDFGFSSVYVLEGGIMNWIAEVDTQLETY